MDFAVTQTGTYSYATSDIQGSTGQSLATTGNCLRIILLAQSKDGSGQCSVRLNSGAEIVLVNAGSAALIPEVILIPQGLLSNVTVHAVTGITRVIVETA